MRPSPCSISLLLACALIVAGSPFSYLAVGVAIFCAAGECLSWLGQRIAEKVIA